MKILFWVCAYFLLLIPCQAEIITVDDDAAADFRSIQEAIHYSRDGDIIEVQSGTYRENIYFHGKAVTLRSTDPNDPNVTAQTIIDGNQADSVVTFAWGEDRNSVITGFTLTNGKALYGSGVSCWRSSPTILSNVISNNVTDEFGARGGGIYCYQSNARIVGNILSDNSLEMTLCAGAGIYCRESSPVISDNQIVRNYLYSDYGAGVCCEDNSNPEISGNLISGNFAEWGEGGGIYCVNSSPGISNNQIVHNTSRGDGAGIRCENSSCVIEDNILTENVLTGQGLFYAVGVGISIEGGAPEVRGNTIANNRTPSDYQWYLNGGGISCHDSSPLIELNRIYSNFVWGGGGGIHCTESSPSIRHNIISGNFAGGFGGGLYLAQESFPIIMSNSILGNRASEWGGGIAFVDDCMPSIRNNIIAGSSFGGGIYWKYALPADFSYNCLWANVDGDYVGWAVAGQDDISADPGFVRVGFWDANGTPALINDDFWVNGDYHLRSQAGRWDPNSQSWVTDNVDSPCLDAGAPGSDWTEELWPHGKRMNMGAYGGTPEASMSTLSVGSIGDLNNDSIVDLRDFARIADSWWIEKSLLREDLDRNGFVDFPDLAIFSGDWLWKRIPADFDVDGDVDFTDYTLLAGQWLQVPTLPSVDIVPFPVGDGIVDFQDLAFLAEHWLENTNP